MRIRIISIILISALIFSSTCIPSFANTVDVNVVGSSTAYWYSGRQITSNTTSFLNILSSIANNTAYGAYLNNFMEGYLSNINTTVDYYLPALNTNVSNIALRLGGPTSTGTYSSFYNLLEAGILNTLTSISSTALGMAQDLYYIRSSAVSAASSAASIDSKTSTLISSVNNISLKLDDIFTYTDTVQMESYFDSYSYNRNIFYYPMGNNYTNNYFCPIIDIDLLTDGKITIIYPLNDAPSNLSLTSSNTEMAFVGSSDGVTFEVFYPGLSTNQFITNSVYNRVDKYWLFEYDFSSLNFGTYQYFTVRPFQTANNLTNSLVINQTPYCLIDASVNRNYIEAIYNQLQTNGAYSGDLSLQLSEIINILDKSTSLVQTDDDINISVDFDSDSAQDVADLIDKTADLMNTGIGITTLLLALDQIEQALFYNPSAFNFVNNINDSFVYYDAPIIP